MLNPNLEQIQLNTEEYQRYSRHLILPEVGLDGQKRLKAASVLCIGTGGLGSPLLLYLAAAGIGNIGIVDFDIVDSSNLQRQVIHGTSWVGRPKIESAKNRIHEITLIFLQFYYFTIHELTFVNIHYHLLNNLIWIRVKMVMTTGHNII